ncbi:MAG TPA: transcriptional regulator [Clostridiales bacterium]|nr:transcriptional regulator [Clostridiales bacterium]
MNQGGDTLENVQALAEEFTACRRTLSALGDENRQYLILEMMQMGECGGVCVGRITAQTHLSRPAVSHHLQILKDAGLIKVRREGTKNYYYFDADTKAMEQLLQMLTHAKEFLKLLPDRSGENREPIDMEEREHGTFRGNENSAQCPPIRR